MYVQYFILHCFICRPTVSKDAAIRTRKPVFRIRIHRIHMFLGLPDPDPLVRGMDPNPDPALDPDPFIIM